MNTSTESNRPTHVVKVRYGQGEGASYERIGVAWADPAKGTAYVKLHGTQIVSEGFTLYPVDSSQ